MVKENCGNCVYWGLEECQNKMSEHCGNQMREDEHCESYEESTYRILYDLIGFAQEDGTILEFRTREEAIEWQLSQGYSDKFQIVKKTKFKEL